MEDQRILHYFISTVGNFQKVTAPVVPDTVPEVEENTNEDTEEFVDPNQTSILDHIASTDIEEAELVSLEPESSNPVEAESTWEIDNDMIGNSDEFQADAEMQEIKTEEVYDLDAEEDEDWDKLEKAEVITEVIVPEATEESTTEMLYGVDNGDIEITNAPINILAKKEVVEDEFAKEDNFNLDFSEDTNEDQDSIPDFF
jgi:hypothetical protein